MNNLKSLVSNIPLPEARSAFYYLSRYLKQATHDDYEKDIFDDYAQVDLGEGVRGLTKILIEFVESSEGKSAKDFTDNEYIKWMDEIDVVEGGLDPVPSAGQISEVENIIKELIPPTLGKNQK